MSSVFLFNILLIAIHIFICEYKVNIFLSIFTHSIQYGLTCGKLAVSCGKLFFQNFQKNFLHYPAQKIQAMTKIMAVNILL